MDPEEKNRFAERLLEEAEKELLEMLWKEGKDSYCNFRILLSWLEEEYEYALKKLGMNTENEIHYTNKLHNIFGHYPEDQPRIPKK